MFKLEPNPTFWAAVGITVPGQQKPESIEIEYRHMGSDEWLTYRQSVSEKPLSDAVKGLVVGWRGADVPYSDEAMDRLMKRWPRASVDLFEAYYRELFEARKKN